MKLFEHSMSMKPKNVMYIVHSLNIGGLEKCVVDLVNGLDRKCFKPMICCLTTTGPFAEKILDNSIEIIEMKKKSGNDFRIPFRLAKLFRRKNVDIVHSGNWGTLVEPFLAAKIARVPKIIHMEQGLELYDLDQLSKFRILLRGLIQYFLSFGIDKTVTVSDDLREYVHRAAWINKKKIKVIYNGVDTEHYANCPAKREKIRKRLGFTDQHILIGSVGRLAEVKNYSNLITAMEIVNKSCPEARLFIIGDGLMRNRLQSQIKELDLGKIVTLLGERNDISELLSAMDIFALPSIFEGISISSLEAMAAGLPVVATRVGGNPEIIMDGITGYLVETKNSKELANSLIKLTRNRKIRSDFSKASLKRVNQVFHNSVMVSEYSKLYS